MWMEMLKNVGKYMKYLTVAEAATQLKVSVQAIYQAIWRKALKKRKIDKQTFTSDEWIEEYMAELHSKQTHSSYNGRKVFDQDKGELSIKMVAERLQTSEFCISWHIKHGRIQAYRKGTYWVIPEAQLIRVQQVLEEYRNIA